MYVLTEGCDSVILLSQYIGDFQPEAQVKGLLGCNFIALICNKNSATFNSISILLYMVQKYRIYINENTLFLTDTVPEKSNQVQLLDLQSFDFFTFYKNLDKGSKKNYVLLAEDPKAELKKIKKKCTMIKAAGGLVRNADDDYLFIYRNKKWDLPKGKVENGEKMKEAALREVEEECGVKIFENGEKLCKTYHVYELNGEIVLKKTNWYDMKVKGKPKLIPQKEEGITKAGWYSKNELDPLLKNTYLLIIDVLAAGDLVNHKLQ